MNEITLTLPYPISANRYWASRVLPGKLPRAVMYVTTEAKAYKAQVAALTRVAGVTAPIEGRVQVEVWLYPHRPQDWAKRQRRLGECWDDSVMCIDLDNANKVLLDALKDVVMQDDAWVRRIISWRMEPDEWGARVVVKVTALSPLKPQNEIYFS